MIASFSDHNYKLTLPGGEIVEGVEGRTGDNWGVYVGITTMQGKIVRKKYAGVKKTMRFCSFAASGRTYLN